MQYFSYFNFSITDIIDILLVAAIVYYLYTFMRSTLAMSIFIGLFVIFVAWQIVGFFHLYLMEKLIGGFMSIGLVTIVIVFQQEIRHFLIQVGKNATFQRSRVIRFFNKRRVEEEANLTIIRPIIEACKTMKKNRTGALIIFVKYYEGDFYESVGEVLDAQISKRLIESLFQRNSPLHDGAVIVSDRKIRAAGCILPLSDNQNLPPQFGLRHRAGIGVTEHQDVLALIVSEETGEVSCARQGKIKVNLNWPDIEKLINKYI